MDLSSFDRRTASGGAGWVYWRPTTEGLLEFGVLRGAMAGLAPHFHDDLQITFVLAGRRRLVVAGEAVDLAAGQCLCIPAGVPHGSLEEPVGAIGLNAYVQGGAYAFAALERDIETLWRDAGRLDAAAVAALARRHRAEPSLAFDVGPVSPPVSEPVGRIARRLGMSRERFSRVFAKTKGMPPHAFQIAGRLNEARRLLQAGETIASVAFETGFADQSHFGRCFRRAYGISPGRYRLG